MSKSDPNAVSQIGEISQKLQQDSTQFSEFETDFINDQASRIDKYGDDTYFSDKQAALIERIHAERDRGEKTEKQQRKKSKLKSEE